MSASLIDKFIKRPKENTDVLRVQTEPPGQQMAQDQNQADWLEDGDDGQLSVDVYQTPDAVVIKSTIAGVRPEDIDIAINNDLITIRGERHSEEDIQEDDYYYQECYWGSFSRSIILPVEVKSEEVEATLKNGVLTVRLPKAQKSKSVSVRVSTA